VDVVGGFGNPGDWTTPLLSLTDDGTGTFVGKAPLADGSYPFVFRVHGGADNVAKNGTHLVDQSSSHFAPPPKGAPSARSVSLMTVPQVAEPSIHVTGTVLFDGHPQPCFAVDLEAGELRQGSKVLAEHDTANYVETRSDGTFDFLVAKGAPYGVIVRYPFALRGLDAGYPQPSMSPVIGIARTNLEPSADIVLPSLDVQYPDYALMDPKPGSVATLPVTFLFSVIAGSSGAQISVIANDIAGNDPLYSSGYGNETSVVWNGMFSGAAGNAKPGQQYFWGTWQILGDAASSIKWNAESLLFPIQFP
jgi:hypothetical protein